MPSRAFLRLGDYVAFRSANPGLYSEQDACERAFLGDTNRFTVPGFCAYCARAVAFNVDYQWSPPLRGGPRVPNWRESLGCPRCGLNNRLRATVHVLREALSAAARQRIYLTEQGTRLFQAVERLSPHVVGSEFLRDGTSAGSLNAHGIRHEDMTALSFADDWFDLICSCDVLEHIPDYRAALQECFRCLKPGGTIVLSVPFLADSEETLVRARVGADGTVTHLLPPEYHFDPLDEAGVLCFQYFGWDLLDTMRKMGYFELSAHFYWSRELGYLGAAQQLFIGHKPPG
jgi:hypothetical protein